MPTPTFITSASASATTLTMPSSNAGDLQFMWAVRNGSTTAPTMPTGQGWQTIKTVSRSGTPAVSARLCWRTFNTSLTSSGTFTNATELVCGVYRPPSGYTLQPGTSNTASSTTATLSYQAITLSDNSGNSYVVGFGGCSNIAQSMATAPAGMTNRTSITGTATIAAMHDTNGGVTSWAATNVSLGTTGQSLDEVVELVCMPAAAPPSQLVQWVSGGRNTGAGGEPGNAFKANLPNASGTGNTYLFLCAYPNGQTPVITDSNGNTWPTLGTTNAPHANAGTGNLDLAVFVCPNVTSGLNVFTCTFGATVSVYMYKIFEFKGIDFTTPVNGSAVAAFITSPTLNSGSYTPGNNNAGGGNLIFTVTSLADNVPGAEPTLFVPALGAALTSGVDIYPGEGGYSLSSATSLALQGASAALNPGFSAVADNDDYNCISLALKLNSSNGTALNAQRVAAIHHYGSSHFVANTVYAMHCPSIGDTRCLCIMDGSQATGTVWDSEGNLYSKRVASSGFWDVEGKSANADLIIYFMVPTGGTANSSIRYYDIITGGSSPYDTSVAADQAQSFNSTTVCTPNNKVTPTGSNYVIISQECLGQGPGLSVSVPSGAIWDLCNYTGQTDGSQIDNSDTMSHWYGTTSGSAITFTYAITSVVSNSCIGGGVIVFDFTTSSTTNQTSFFTLGNDSLLSLVRMGLFQGDTLLDVSRKSVVAGDALSQGLRASMLEGEALSQGAARDNAGMDWMKAATVTLDKGQFEWLSDSAAKDAAGSDATIKGVVVDRTGADTLSQGAAHDNAAADSLGTALTNQTAFGRGGVEWLSDGAATDRAGADGLADAKAADQAGGDTASRGASVSHAGADALLAARSLATVSGDALTRGISLDRAAADSLGTATVSLTAFGTGALEWTGDALAQTHVAGDTLTRLAASDRVGTDALSRGSANDKVGSESLSAAAARATAGGEWLGRQAAAATLSADTTAILIAQTALGRAGLEWTVKGFSVAHVAFDWLGPAFVLGELVTFSLPVDSVTFSTPADVVDL